MPSLGDAGLQGREHPPAIGWRGDDFATNSNRVNDNLTPVARSAAMRAVKGRDTKPEMQVRRMLHALGYRYRTHLAKLPGRPDLAFTRRKAAVFVHGCFWHGHDCPRGGRMPKANAGFWRVKIDRNRERDGRTAAALEVIGWRSAVIWECELREPDRVAATLQAFLGPPRSNG